MFPPVDTKSVPAVATFLRDAFHGFAPGGGAPELLDRVYADVIDLFEGRQPAYGAVDLRYHDLEHTLQATVCLAALLTGTLAAPDAPRLTTRQFELAITAVLLHDAGYLKLRSDSAGTGAKYTFCHVLRSCAFAASYLPSVGANELEISGVLGAINCTGPSKQIGRLHFRDPVEKFIGCALATADYLGQMAAADYPDELGILFAEFTESDDFMHVAPARRLFASAEALTAATPGFWRTLVRPKLEHDFQGVYRYLARPYPDGPNDYLAAVERNIRTIEERLARVPAVAAAR